VAGVDKPGEASFQVHEEDVTALAVEPSSLNLKVGEKAVLHVRGQGKTKAFEMFAHSDLKTTVGGPNPEAATVDGNLEVTPVKS
jgi:hypothetical protein